MVNHQQLMRVYGALMWSLGRVLNSPEVPRVYIGSFWDQPLHYEFNRKLFEAEAQDLYQVDGTAYELMSNHTRIFLIILFFRISIPCQ